MWHIEWRGMRPGRPIETVLLGGQTHTTIKEGMDALSRRLANLLETEVNLTRGSEGEGVVLLVAVERLPSPNASGSGGSREPSLFPETNEQKRERPLYGN